MSAQQKPTPVRQQLAGWLARDDQGNTITRKAQCLCGAMYTQSLLNPAYLEGASAGVVAEFRRQIPDGYVPRNCPPCERRELGRLANRVSVP